MEELVSSILHGRESWREKTVGDSFIADWKRAYALFGSSSLSPTSTLLLNLQNIDCYMGSATTTPCLHVTWHPLI